MAVAYDNGIYHWKILYMTWYFGVSFRPHKAKWTTPLLEYGVKENAQAAREFDIVTGMAKPCCSERLRCGSAGEEAWLNDSDSRRCSVWPLEFTSETPPGYTTRLANVFRRRI